MSRSKVVALGASIGLILTACSPGSGGSDPTTNTGSETSESTDQATVTVRIWDETIAPAYEESFAAFEDKNQNINVELELVSWDQYWERLPRDISSGDMADIFWVNSSNFGLYVDNGNLLSITDELGDDHDEWVESIVNLYTRDDKLWGVPQIWDSIGLFYNKSLVDEAGVDVNSLKWVPGAGDGDTLLAAAQKLTKDSDGNTADSDGFNANSISTYGFNSQDDLQAIYIDFLAQNGAEFQGDDDMFNFDTPEGIEAFQYLVDLVNEYHVAPPASETNLDGNYSRDLFVRGELGLFQSGPYSLNHIVDNADFEWGIAPLVEGPEGRISVVHGVSAVGNAATDNKDATVEVLKWMGSAEGQAPIAELGVSFPGAVDAQGAYVDYWAAKGVDVSVFINAAEEPTAPAPRGPQVGAGSGVISPIIKDIFLGSVSVEDGLKRAQEEGNAAMAE